MKNNKAAGSYSFYSLKAWISRRFLSVFFDQGEIIVKIESIHIQNFKRFQDLEISFKNGILDEVSDRYLILGDNGTGKTTLLQAIALPLALATGRIRDISDFDWISFIPGCYWRGGSPRIELQVLFDSPIKGNMFHCIN